MSNLLLAVLYGIVEGITEWLPVSSTGHLIVLNSLLPLPVSREFFAFFEVFVQLGAILAVLATYFARLNPLSKQKTDAEKKRTYKLWGYILLSVLPSAVIGAVLDDALETYCHNALTVSLMLIGYGVAFIVISCSKRERTPLIGDASAVSARQALFMGLWQVASLVPGTSRSGATILGGLLAGLPRQTATEFSFFMAIPTMLGACLLKAMGFARSGVSVSTDEILLLWLTFAVSFAVSLLTVCFLTELVKRHTFAPFGVYRIVLGTLILLNTYGR